MFDYIYENIEKIKNPNDVNIIYISKDKRGIYPAAFIRGNLEHIRLAESKIWMAPFPPMGYLCNTMGHFYWQNFTIFDNRLAINKINVLNMAYVTENNIVNVYSHFKDGQTLCIANPSKKHFFSKLKIKLEREMGMPLEDITEKVRLENELSQ